MKYVWLVIPCAKFKLMEKRAKPQSKYKPPQKKPNLNQLNKNKPKLKVCHQAFHPLINNNSLSLNF